MVMAAVIHEYRPYRGVIEVVRVRHRLNNNSQFVEIAGSAPVAIRRVTSQEILWSDLSYFHLLDIIHGLC
jgi:hypothetical protein